jgi:methyl-accepting chemotaxis protein
VNESGKTLGQIEQAVSEVSAMIADITSAAQAQTSGIAQVNTAVSQMDEMTQQNAALVEEATAASQAVAEQATHMATMMEFFRTDSSAPSAQTGAAAMNSPRTASSAARSTAPKARASGSGDGEWAEF